MPTIEGASPEQRRLLEEILAGFGPTRIEHIVVRPFRETSEEGDLPLPGDHGDEIFIGTDPQDRRGYWEAELIAVGFARRSKAAGLRKVASFAFVDGAGTLELAPPAIQPLEANALEQFAADVAAAAGEARLESFDVLDRRATPSRSRSTWTSRTASSASARANSCAQLRNG